MSFTTEHRKQKCLHRENVPFEGKQVILNLMDATHLNKVGMGQQNAEKVKKMKQLEENFETNWVNWQQVIKVIGYKRLS